MVQWLKCVLLMGLLMAFLCDGFAQKDTIQGGKLSRKIQSIQENKQRVIEEGGMWITPYVTPGYTPELGGTISAGGLLSFKTNRNDSLIQRSSVPFTFGVSTTKGYFFISRFNSYWNQDKFRFSSDLVYKSMPDNYWGKGYELASTTESASSVTGYNRNWFWLSMRFAFRLKENLYLGPSIDINYTKAHDYHLESGELKPAFGDGYFSNDHPFNVGVGAQFEYDSRDLPVNAWSGVYLKGAFNIYGENIGGQNNYQVYEFDYRQYQTIVKSGRVLAWQVRGRFALNDVPWAELSQLGTPFDLRGYTWGRYRDKTMLFGILEYRHTFYKQDNTPSKHGLVAWIGLGAIAPSIGHFDSWLPNAGVGYRFEVQPRMNLRIDYGVGKGTSGFYINFNESF